MGGWRSYAFTRTTTSAPTAIIVEVSSEMNPLKGPVCLRICPRAFGPDHSLLQCICKRVNSWMCG